MTLHITTAAQVTCDGQTKVTHVRGPATFRNCLKVLVVDPDEDAYTTLEREGWTHIAATDDQPARDLCPNHKPKD